MNKQQKDIPFSIVGTIIMIAAVIILLSKVSDKRLNDVKSGEYSLVCHMKEKGWSAIDKERIVDYTGDAWIFDNGYSKSCKVFKNTDKEGEYDIQEK